MLHNLLIFKAVHDGTGQVLAIKIIAMEADEKQNESITKEIEILKKCNNQNVVAYYGCIWNENDLWVRVLLLSSELFVDFNGFLWTGVFLILPKLLKFRRGFDVDLSSNF